MNKLKIILMTLVMFLSCSLIYTNTNTNDSSFNKKDYISYDEVTTNTLNLSRKNCKFYCWVNNNMWTPEQLAQELDTNYLYIIETEALTDFSKDNSILRSKEVKCFFDAGIAADTNNSIETLNRFSWTLCEISNCVSIEWWESCAVDYSVYVYQFLGDKVPPTFTGTNNFVVNVNNMMSKEQIASHITAFDETDGKVPVTVVSSTYDPANRTKGIYDLVVEAKDSSGNASRLTVKVHVVDVDAPVVTGNSVRVRHDQIPSMEAILKDISVTDNYDSNLKLNIVNDGFTGHGGKLGTYNITVNATDTSGNVSNNKVVSIEVYDEIKPDIVVNGLNGAKELYVGNNAKLSLEDLKAKISVVDDYKLAPTRYDLLGYEEYVKVFDKTNSKTPITINAFDAYGNPNQLVFNIVVTDKIAPTFELDSYFVVLGEGVSLTTEQIKQLASKVAGVAVNEIKDVTLADTTDPNIKKARITMSDDTTIEINIETGVNINSVVMVWYHYIYVWFTVLFNIDEYYKTGSFFEFDTRCKSIGEIYRNGVFYNR